jgi:3-hydroxybutyryl-CoA dehydrogenase
MITPIARRGLLQSTRYARTFSSSRVLASQEVKKLGVIGAGQMVGGPAIFIRSGIEMLIENRVWA